MPDTVVVYAAPVIQAASSGLLPRSVIPLGAVQPGSAYSVTHTCAVITIGFSPV
ncbi:hypothetical protein [Pseudonocardia thermophila]|uniref:hypothetical protein n=1 Tax=Pseudonocardia thermophila TaxID=1848 RepID=UPI001356692E|nr:hypothetical protein [Pseudonocardia thermophila]